MLKVVRSRKCVLFITVSEKAYNRKGQWQSELFTPTNPMTGIFYRKGEKKKNSDVGGVYLFIIPNG